MTNDKRMTKHENRRSKNCNGLCIKSLAPDLAEDQVQFFGFLPEDAGLGLEVRLRGGDHAQEELCFASLFAASADLVLEILPRDSVVGLAIVRAHACARSNQLFDQSVINRTLGNPFCKPNNRFPKSSSTFFQIENRFATVSCLAQFSTANFTCGFPDLLFLQVALFLNRTFSVIRHSPFFR